MGSTVHLLVIDNRDSFVYNVVELLRSLPELTFEVIPEGELELSSLPEHDGLILSPGPGVPSEFPRMQALIRAEVGVKPILGICLGHQHLPSTTALRWCSSLRLAMGMPPHLS